MMLSTNLLRFALGLGVLTSLGATTLVTSGCSAPSNDDAVESGESDLNKRPEDVVQQLVNGSSNACALVADGRVFCWGAMMGGDGRPYGGPIRPERDKPTFGLTDVTQIAHQYSDWCVLHRNGEVSCWGFHTNGGYMLADRLTKMEGLKDVAAIDGKCALHANGKVSCWKDLNGPRPEVELVEGVEDIVQIADPGRFACGVRKDGQVICWGTLDNVIGKFGYSPPTIIPDLTDVVEVAGTWGTACARKSDGHVVCWGSPNAGLIGTGVFNTANAARDNVLGIDDAVKIAMAPGTACAVLASGGVKCWGTPPLGGTSTALPVSVPDLANIIDIHAKDSGSEVGGATVCARDKDGEAFCWGRATYSLWGTMDIGYTSLPKRSIAFDAF